MAMCVVSSQFLHKHPGHRLGCNPKTGAEDIKGHLFFKPIEWDKLERRELKPPFKPKIVSDTMNWHLSEHFVSMAKNVITVITASASGSVDLAAFPSNTLLVLCQPA